MPETSLSQASQRESTDRLPDAVAVVQQKQLLIHGANGGAHIPSQ